MQFSMLRARFVLMAAAVTIGAGLSTPAQALPASQPFSITATTWPTTGSLGSGLITWDTAFVPSLGAFNVTPDALAGSLTISFTPTIPGFSGNFSQTDDDFFGFGSPLLSFQNGLPLGLNFVVTALTSPTPITRGFGFADAISSLTSTSILTSSVGGTVFGYFNGDGFGTGAVTYGAVTVVPEPSTICLMLAGGAVLWLVRRRKVSDTEAARTLLIPASA